MNGSGRATEKTGKSTSCFRSAVSADPHGPTVWLAREKAEYRPCLLGSPAHYKLQDGTARRRDITGGWSFSVGVSSMGSF